MDEVTFNEKDESLSQEKQPLDEDEKKMIEECLQNDVDEETRRVME